MSDGQEPQQKSSVSICISGTGEDVECKYSGTGAERTDIGWRLGWAMIAAHGHIIGSGVWEAMALAIQAMAEAEVDVDYEGREALIAAADAILKARKDPTP